MLTGTSDLGFGEARIRTAIVLGVNYRALLVWRSGLLFDSRFLVPQAGTRDVGTIYLVHDGDVAIDGKTYTSPVGFALPAREYERYAVGAPNVRTWGDPSVTLDIQLDAADVRAPVGCAHGPLALPSATWDAFSDLAEAFVLGNPIESGMRSVLERLAENQIIAPDIARATEPPPEALVRIWEALRPFYGRWELSLELPDLSKLADVSARQISRDTKSLNDWLGRDGVSFRDHLHVLRLRIAVLLLSAHGPTIGEVAARVGYRSVDALSRAFRDAGLPPPHVVREAVLVPV